MEIIKISSKIDEFGGVGLEAGMKSAKIIGTIGSNVIKMVFLVVASIGAIFFGFVLGLIHKSINQDK